jgi:hypothetical protein
LIGSSNFKAIVDPILTLQSRIFKLEQPQNIDSIIGHRVRSVISGSETSGRFTVDIAKLKEQIILTTETHRRHQEKDLKEVKEAARPVSERHLMV